MRASIHQFVFAVFLAFAVVVCAADPNATDSTTRDNSGPNRMAPVGVEEAFRKALGSIKAQANLMDPTAQFTISRTVEGKWMVQANGLSDVPPGGLAVFVDDNGSTQIILSNTNADAQAWLSSAVASKPDPTIKLRPEVAFRQGIEALAKWWKVTPDSFRSPECKTIVARRGKEEWQLRIRRPSPRSSPEWKVVIKADGEIETYPSGNLGL